MLSRASHEWKHKGHKAQVNVNALASHNQVAENQLGGNAGQPTSDTMDTDGPQTQNEAGASSTAATKSRELGLKRKSEPILGYRTTEGDAKGNLKDYQLVVQIGIKKKPQYDLQSRTRMGA